MNPANDPLSLPAEEQAALWATRLDASDLTVSDRQELDAWLALDARHPALLQDYQGLSLVLERQLPALVSAGAVASPTPEPAPAARRSSARWLAPLLIAGGCAAAVVVFALRPAPSVTFSTTASQRRTVTLADGSQVQLNARTSLTSMETHGERHVQLSGGEAYFIVAKNPERPFIVDTPSGTVRVTGTIFDVSSNNTELNVTVVEGSVQVNPKGGGSEQAPASLKAQDQFTAGSGVKHLSAGALEDCLAWRDGDVVFNGTPLAVALASFNRYDGRTLIADPSVADLKVGGRFKLDNLDNFLEAVDAQSDYHVQVTRSQDGAVEIGPRAAR